MTYRVTYRPISFSTYPTLDPVKAAPRSKPVSKGWAAGPARKLTAEPFAAPKSRGALAAPKAQQSKAARRRGEVAANKGYGGAFVMMDLTETAAHEVRLAAMQDIAEHDARTPGGILFPDAYVGAEESHISLVRGIRAPLLHPEDVTNGHEAPMPGHVDAFGKVAAHPAAKLQLGPRVEYWDGPAVGPAQYRVAALVIEDPAGALPGMQRAWAAAGGSHVPADKPLHLTLAYLRLDQARLPAELEAKIAMKVGQAGRWTQTDVVYSGRYGKTFASAKLPEGT